MLKVAAHVAGRSSSFAAMYSSQVDLIQKPGTGRELSCCATTVWFGQWEAWSSGRQKRGWAPRRLHVGHDDEADSLYAQAMSLVLSSNRKSQDLRFVCKCLIHHGPLKLILTLCTWYRGELMGYLVGFGFPCKGGKGDRASNQSENGRATNGRLPWRQVAFSLDIQRIVKIGRSA